MKLKKWTKLSEKNLYINNHWTYKLDDFEIEGEQTGEYHYVHSPGSTMVIPFSNPNEIILVNQFRYLNQKESLEFPCGSIENGLTKEQNALKELREESGFTGNLEYVGEFSPYTGVSNEICSVYIAKELEISPLPKDETEEFEIIKMSLKQFEEIIKENKIWDGLTLAAWILVKNHINM